MTCPDCRGYGFVEVDGQHAKEPCPTCKPAARVFAQERVARIRSNTRTVNVRVPRNRAPVEFTRCPLHRTKVGRDGEGRLLGRCDGCAADYAKALRWMRAHPYRRVAA